MDSFVITVIASYVVAAIIIVFITRRQSRKSSDEYREVVEYSVSRIEDMLVDKVPRASIVDEKKKEIQRMGPKTFYYLDESQVRYLYPQVFQEPELKQIQTQETKRFKVGIAGNFPVLQPKVEKGNAQEVTKVYDAQQELAMKYNKVEQFFFDKGKVTFGLDEFEFDESEINEFESNCDKMKSKFHVDIPDDVYGTFVVEKMREFAVEYTKKLASSSGYIALQGEFIVVNTADDDCILSYAHPLNEHLPPEDPQVRIQIRCSRSFLTPSGKATFKPIKSVKITSLGKVVSWNGKDNILEVSPIAIY
jgi:hypothetical protein